MFGIFIRTSDDVRWTFLIRLINVEAYVIFTQRQIILDMQNVFELALIGTVLQLF